MACTYPMKFAEQSVGGRISVLSKLKCFDPSHEAHLMEAEVDGVSFHLTGLIDGSFVNYSLMNVLFKQHYPTPVLVVDHDSVAFHHPSPTWTSLHETIDVCAGFGGFSQGSSACGFYTKVAVDMNDRMIHLFSKQCNSETIVGDICQLSTLLKIWDAAKGGLHPHSWLQLPAIFVAR